MQTVPISLTLPKQLLAELEAEAKKLGTVVSVQEYIRMILKERNKNENTNNELK